MSSFEHADGLLADPLEALTDEELQQTFAATVKEYAHRREDGAELPAFSNGGGAADVTGTEAAIASSAILEAAGVEIFELGLWKAWGTI